MVTEMQIKILEKLYIHGYIGAKHTSEENIPKWFPKSQRGEAKEEFRKLLKTGLVNFHPTGYEVQVSLNSARIAEIRRLIGFG